MTGSPGRRQGTLGGAAVTLMAEAVALPAAVITAMVVTRAFGPGVYGSYSVVATTVAVTEWLLIAVFARAVVKFVAESDDWRPVAATAFRVYLMTGLAIGALFWGLSGLVARALQDPDLGRYFALFALQIPIFAVGAASRNVLAGQARYRQQAVASGVGWFARATCIVLFVRLGYGIDGAIAGSIAGTALGSLVAFILMGWPGWRHPGFPVGQLLQLALPAFLTLLSTRLTDQVGLLSVQTFAAGRPDVGYYGAAMNVAILTSVVAAAVSPVLVSSLTRAIHRREQEEARDIVVGAMRFGLALFPLAAIVAGAAAELAPLLFGSAFTPAGPLVAALIVAAVARTNLSMMGALLVAGGRAWRAAALAVPLPVVAVLLHSWVIPRFGGPGAALVTMAVCTAAVAAFAAATCRTLGVAYPASTLLRSVVIAAVLWAAAVAWSTPGPLVLVKTLLLAAIVPVSLLASGELSRRELAVIRAQLPGGSGRA